MADVRELNCAETSKDGLVNGSVDSMRWRAIPRTVNSVGRTIAIQMERDCESSEENSKPTTKWLSQNQSKGFASLACHVDWRSS